MATIFKPKGTSYWWGRVQRSGRQLRRSLKTTSKTEAQRRLTRWIDELDAMAWGDKPIMTFDEAMLHFLAYAENHLKPASLRRYEISARALTPHLSGLHLHRISSGALAGFEAARRAGGASAPTIRRDLACLSSMFETVVTDHDLEIPNPVPAFLRKRRRRGLRESAPRTRYLSAGEEIRLLAACGDYLRPLVSFAIDTGLRLEEQLSLEWRQVDMRRREITVERTKSGKPRRVPLLPRATDTLHNLPRYLHSPYVFTKADGSRYGKLTRGLEGARTRAEILHLQWHDLRRTCGCRLLQDHGMAMDRVREWLGHSSIAQTERAYAFLEVEQLHEAVGTVIETVRGE